MLSSSEIFDELRNYRQVKAMIKIVDVSIRQMLDQQQDVVIPETILRLLYECLMKDHLISGWLDLLTTEERFIIQTHLIDGLDWARTIVEYENKWGVINGRSERTLKRIQAKAINRIVVCLNHLDSSIYPK